MEQSSADFQQHPWASFNIHSLAGTANRSYTLGLYVITREIDFLLGSLKFLMRSSAFLDQGFYTKLPDPLLGGWGLGMRLNQL